MILAAGLAKGFTPARLPPGGNFLFARIAGPMLTTYRRIIGLLDKRGRQRFALLIGMMLLLGLIDMAAGASILPFLMVVSNPKIVHSNPQIAILYEALDFRSQKD